MKNEVSLHFDSNPDEKGKKKQSPTTGIMNVSFVITCIAIVLGTVNIF